MNTMNEEGGKDIFVDLSEKTEKKERIERRYLGARSTELT